jgi:hypothetical protein
MLLLKTAKKNQNILFFNNHKSIFFNQQNLLFSLNSNTTIHNPNLINYWFEKTLYLNQLNEFTKGWRNELLLQFRKNNTQMVLHSAKRPDPIYRQHILLLANHKNLKQKAISTLSLSFQTGRLGFVKNQKKTFVAADSVITAALWIVKRHHSAVTPLKFRFIGNTNNTSKHKKQLNKYFQATDNKSIYSFEDATPISFGATRLKALGRKRFRFHLYNFKALANRKKNNTDLSNLIC